MQLTTGIKLDSETKIRLDKLASIKERKPHWLIKKAIAEYLEREEEKEKMLQEDRERWEEFMLTGYSIENDVVSDWLDALARGEKKPCPK
jgi:predicted transcriptional regulator